MITRAHALASGLVWLLRTKARRYYPHSPRMQRQWVHNQRYIPPVPLIHVGSNTARKPAMFERQSHIPRGTKFRD